MDWPQDTLSIHKMSRSTSCSAQCYSALTDFTFYTYHVLVESMENLAVTVKSKELHQM